MTQYNIIVILLGTSVLAIAITVVIKGYTNLGLLIGVMGALMIMMFAGQYKLPEITETVEIYAKEVIPAHSREIKGSSGRQEIFYQEETHTVHVRLRTEKGFDHYQVVVSQEFYERHDKGEFIKIDTYQIYE